MIWRCPACRAQLAASDKSLECLGCAAMYEVIDGIPDLRYPPCADSFVRDDNSMARGIAADAAGKSDEELVRAFFSVREGTDGWSRHDTEVRTRQSLVAPLRLRVEIDGWLNTVTGQGTFLDLGCGLGGFLTAAGAAAKPGIGIDNRMSVLVVARRLIEREGGSAILACANAEALPLADAGIRGVVMYDVVEHVERLERVLSELSRVTAPGGAFACSTPNRFSIAPEPHVRVWGVGWLPRRYQNAYVKKRSGRDYSGTRLLSPSELGRLLRRHTQFDAELRVPPIPNDEVASSIGVRRAFARVYNLVAGISVARPMLLLIGPFFQLVAVKRAGSNREEGRHGR